MSNFLQGFKAGLGTTGPIFSAENLGKAIGSNIAGITSAGAGLIGGLLSNGYETNAGSFFNSVGDIAGLVPGPVGAIVGGATKLLGGVTNAAFGMKTNQAALNEANRGTEYYNTFNSTASSFDEVQNPVVQAGIQNPYKGGWFKKGKARRRNEALRRERAAAEAYAYRNVDNNIENIAENQIDNLLYNYVAFGGPLHTKGSIWDTGLTAINNGGTHESNPNGGIPMGVDSEGIPNLVEEGETIYNDYVFSNRIKVPNSIRQKYKLKKGITFADASKKLSKEAEERPNDPISQRGLDILLSDLAMEQEAIKMKKDKNSTKKVVNKFDEGDSIDRDIIIPEQVDITNPRFGDFGTLEYDLGNLFELKSASSKTDENIKPLNTSLRYAPAIGLGLATLTDALGITNKPDYSSSDALLKLGAAAKNVQGVKYTPNGTYMKYKPFDRLFYSNLLTAQANATRRAILNNSNRNRMSAIAGLLGADYNAQQQLGNLVRQAEEYNQDQRFKVTEFNNAVNRANAEGFLKAAIANQEAKAKANALGLEAQMAAYQMRDKAKFISNEAKSSNMSRFLTSLGNIGKENQAINQLLFRIKTGIDGNIDDALLKSILPK